jgi:SPP1 gp7 family putative phage head morphogenesis protein
MPKENLSNQIADLNMSHAVDLERFTANETQAALKLLNDLESKLAGDIANVNPTGVPQTAYKKKRQKELLKQTQATIKTAYKGIATENQNALKEVAQIESKFARDLVNKPIGVDLASVALAPEQLKELARDTVIEGTQVKEWWDRQSEELRFAFNNTMKEGIARGETVDELVKRVRGTRANGFKDGVMKTSRAKAEALVRTSTQQVSNNARRATYENNTDVIKAVQQVSTLDLRTSDICIARSGLQWSLPNYEPIGHSIPHKGGPPVHWNCRSTEIPVTKSWGELSKTGIKQDGPGRPATDLDKVFRERLKKQGFSQEQIDKAVKNARASMDGEVADDLNYMDWLKGKPKTKQQEVLGKSKWELWQKGKVTKKQLINQNNRPLTVDELKRKVDIKTSKPKPKPKAFEPLNLDDFELRKTYYNEQSSEIFKHAKATAAEKKYLGFKNPYDIKKNELEALENYTGSAFVAYNKTLRGTLKPTGNYKKYIMRRVNHIERIIDKAPPIKDDLLAYRGFGGRAGEPLGDLFEKARAGENLSGTIIEDKGFLSLSLDKKVSEGFASSNDYPIFMKIEIPKGSRNITFANNSGESELIGSRHVDFEIIESKIVKRTEGPNSRDFLEVTARLKKTRGD